MRQTTGVRKARRPVQSAPGHERHAGPGGGAHSGRSGLLTWLADKVRSVGDWLFRADDAHAIASGWQITPGRSGLSRTYRDPRFNALARCDQCYGTGKDAGGACARCAGTGRNRHSARGPALREQRRDR
jgi:hypothetical protein